MIKQIIKLAKQNEHMGFNVKARHNGQWLEITKDKTEIFIGKDRYVVTKDGTPLFAARTANFRNEILQMPLGRTPEIETLNINFTTDDWNIIYNSVLIYWDNI